HQRHAQVAGRLEHRLRVVTVRIHGVAERAHDDADEPKLAHRALDLFVVEVAVDVWVDIGETKEAARVLRPQGGDLIVYLGRIRGCRERGHHRGADLIVVHRFEEGDLRDVLIENPTLPEV